MKKLNSGFIMSIVSSVLLLLEVIGVKVDVPYVNEVTMAVLGVLVALGVVQGAKSMPKKISGDNAGSTDIIKAIDDVADAIEDVTEDADNVDLVASDIDDQVDKTIDDKDLKILDKNIDSDEVPKSDEKLDDDSKASQEK